MKRLFPLLVFGGLAFGGTIPVTGHGSFSWDFFTPTTLTLGFSGSDGTGSVSFFSWNIPSAPTPQGVLSGQSRFNHPDPTPATQTVDGIQSIYYDLIFGGGGPQYLTLFDASGNVLISQSIVGYIQITDYELPYGPRFLPSGQMNDNWYATGTFLVLPVPEPSSRILLCIGICFTGLMRRMRKPLR